MHREGEQERTKKKEVNYLYANQWYAMAVSQSLAFAIFPSFFLYL